ncbi:MAG TPA: hypothetical protein VLA58_00750, partial [Chitinophagaceae bacterium]|nr:hypothetical protein [Chitinophagaceae bacterium]
MPKQHSSGFRNGKDFIRDACLLLFFVLFSQLSLAQPGSEKGLPFITNYSTKLMNGQSQFWSAIEDDRGFMYFGSGDIQEYDGLAWRTVHYERKNNSTINRALAKGEDGKVYYGAYGDFGYLEVHKDGTTHAVSLLNLVPDSSRKFFDIWSVRAGKEGVYFQARDKLFRVDNQQKVKVWKPATSLSYIFYHGGTLYAHQARKGICKLVNDSLVLIPGGEVFKDERVRVMLPYGDSSSLNKQYMFISWSGKFYLYDGISLKPFEIPDQSFFGNFIVYQGLLLPNGNYALATTGEG